MDHKVLNQVFMDYLEAMQTTSRSLEEALDNNENDIACLDTLLNARRKEFVQKLKQKEGKTSISLAPSMALKLYDKILYSLKQKAQTMQFGKFLSDIDIEQITKDYHHILEVHIHEGDKTCIENCFRYFEYAVHFEDEPTEIEQCRSAKRNEERMHRFNTNDHDLKGDRVVSKDVKEHKDIDIWKLRQHYVQSQLGTIHSYLVHSKWKDFVRQGSEQRVYDDREHKYDKEADSVASQYEFGIDHDHPYLHSVHCAIRHELLLHKQQPLPVNKFQREMAKAIKHQNAMQGTRSD
eukprot:255283_1